MKALRTVQFSAMDSVERRAALLNDAQGALRDFISPVNGKAEVVTGAKGGNVALANLITALAKIGLIKDSTT